MHNPVILIRSQEPSIRLSCIQLLRHGCASNVMKVGRQAFQETYVHQIFIESCDMHLLKKSLHSSPCKNLLMFLLNRSAIFQRRFSAWSNVKCSRFSLISFIEKNVLRLVKY